LTRNYDEDDPKSDVEDPNVSSVCPEFPLPPDLMPMCTCWAARTG